MSKQVRIQKLLAEWGIASRRTVEKMIENGRIEVDGKKLVSQGLQVDPENPPQIRIDQKTINRPEKQLGIIYMMHKPYGILCTLHDELNRKTIVDYMPQDKRLYPVGRLDADSTGLLLITNMGILTNRLLHPSFKVEKEYIVKIKGSPLTQEEIQKFTSGLMLKDGLTAPCKLRALKIPLTYSVIIKEGKKRQVRRMFESLKKEVKNLHRVRFGSLEIGNLRPGEIRPLTPEESSVLLVSVGL